MFQRPAAKHERLRGRRRKRNFGDLSVQFDQRNLEVAIKAQRRLGKRRGRAVECRALVLVGQGGLRNLKIANCGSQCSVAEGTGMKTRIAVLQTLFCMFALLSLPSMRGQQAPASGAAPTRPLGPCDIYASAGDPCVAAHSTTRALFASYNGPLYQVLRQSDGKTLDIGVVPPVGVARSGCGWIRGRGRPGSILRQHVLLDHHCL